MTKDRKRQLRQIKRKFGLTEIQYEALLESQGFRCAICGTQVKYLKNHLSVDHNHYTKKVRGLLCQSCNMALGLLKEDTWIILKAYDYLIKHEQ